MRVLLATHSLPQPSANGGPMTCWAVLQELLARGHEVVVVALHYPDDPFMDDERRALVRKAGADLETVPVEPLPRGSAARARRFLAPSIRDLFPAFAAGPRVREIVARRKPDVIFAYHWDTLAATHGIREVPRMGAVGDPWHLPRLRRWEASPPNGASWMKEGLGVLRARIHYPRAMVRLLQPCSVAASFQSQTAADLRAAGVSGCAYYPTPLEDRAGPRWKARRADANRAGAPVRVLVGPSNLEATSTRAGLELFATEILPPLHAALDEGRIEIRIVGEGLPPGALARILPRKGIELVGRIEPADAEFAGAAIQLVPTPFVLGIRIRILSAMSFGCCVIAHASEKVNIPELRDGENALTAPDGDGLARALLRAAEDPALRERMGAEARRTFEQVFEQHVAGARIVAKLERLAGTSTTSGGLRGSQG